MTLEQQIHDYIKRLEQLYSDANDTDQLLDFFDPNILVIGAEKQENISGAEAVKNWLAQKKTCFSVHRSQYDVLPISEDVGLVSGLILFDSIDASPQMPSLWISALVKRTEDGLRLASLHFSPADRAEASESIQDDTLLNSNQKILSAAAQQQKNKDMELLTNNLPGGALQCKNDSDMTILQMSDGFLALLGYTREEMSERFQNRYIGTIHPDDLEAVRRLMAEQMQSGNTIDLEYRIIQRDGTPLWVLEKSQLVTDSNGDERFYCIIVDINNIKMAQEELRLSLERHQIIMDQTNDVIFEWDTVADILVVSQNWVKTFGYEPEVNDVKHLNVYRKYAHPDDQKKLAELIDKIKNGCHYQEMIVRLLRKGGDYLWVRLRATAQYDAYGNIAKVVGVIMDIDKEFKQAQKLKEKAERDLLTRLYNKGTTQSMVSAQLEDSPNLAALLIIDVDNFKYINDTLGHSCGDAVLSDIAGKLRSLFRSTDVLGRIGGDEFVVFMKGIPAGDFAAKKAKQVLDTLREIKPGGEGTEGVSCSIGISLCPQHGISFHELYQRADAALYSIKNNGKNNLAFFRDELGFKDLERKSELLFESNAPIDSNAPCHEISDDLVAYVFDLLYQSPDMNMAIQSILQIVGQQFDVSRTYIFESDEQDITCSNTFEWCSDGVEPQKENLQQLRYYEDMGGDYPSNFDHDGIFYCRDISEMPPRSYEILAAQDIKSMLQCAISDGGAFKGFIGFDECRNNRYWTRGQIVTLSMIAKIISVFLLKKRAQDRLEENFLQLKNLLDLHNAWVYIVDPTDFTLKFFNQKVLEGIPSAAIDQKCYQVFFERNEPCMNCPLLQDEKLVVKNDQLGRWLELNGCKIDWHGQEAQLISCHDVTDYLEQKKDDTSHPKKS